MFVCPPGGTIGSAWGTDIYTDDSSICTAAVHALPDFDAATGGVVRIQIAAGGQSYHGRERHGVTTSDRQAFPGSFSVVAAFGRGVPSADNPLRISWTTTVDQLVRANVLRSGSGMWLRCPAWRADYAVRGSDIYTTDSSICTAALHAFQIGTQGGAVAIRLENGRSSYAASMRNQVETQVGSASEHSFSFVNNGNAGPGDVANRPTPPPPPALVDIRVCVIDAQGALTEVAAHFNPATGDTTAAGKRFGEAYPADRRYASKASWYINNEPVLVGGRRFVKYGLPRTIGVSEVTRATAHQGVGVFVERGVALGRVAVIYLPLRHGCEFQPYQVQAKK